MGGRNPGRCSRFRAQTVRTKKQTGGVGSPDVKCVDCGELVKRERAIKHRSSTGWAAFFRCARCTAEVDAYMDHLMSLPLVADE